MSDGCRTQPVDDAKPRPQGRGQQTGPRRGADEREFLERDLHRPCARPLTDDDVELVVFERRVEDLFDRGRHPVNLVDEQHVARRQVRQDRRQIPGPFENRTGGRPHRRGRSDEVTPSRLPEPEDRTAVVARASSADAAAIDTAILAHPVLADVLSRTRGGGPPRTARLIDARAVTAIVHLDDPTLAGRLARHPRHPQIGVPCELTHAWSTSVRAPPGSPCGDPSLFGEGP